MKCVGCFTYAIMDEFYLSLLSDSSMDIFPKNKQFSFTTKLNHPIQVQKEQWVVALEEIMTPSEVYNISHNSNYFYVHFYDENVLERLGKSKMNTVCMKDGSCPEIKLFIPAGNYNSPQHLVRASVRRTYAVYYVQKSAAYAEITHQRRTADF